MTNVMIIMADVVDVDAHDNSDDVDADVDDDDGRWMPDVGGLCFVAASV